MPLLLTDIDRVILDYDKSFESWLRLSYPNYKQLIEKGDTQTSTDTDLPDIEKLQMEFNESSAFGYLNTYDDVEKWFLRIANEFRPRIVGITSCGDSPTVEAARWNNIKELFPDVFHEIIFLPFKSTQRSILRYYNSADVWVTNNWYFAYEGASEGISSAFMNRKPLSIYKEHISYPESDLIMDVDHWEDVFNLLVA